MHVERIAFDFRDKVPFAEQMRNTATADILVGMHGAGLTHTLWMPPWAALVELLNCGEVRCYRDLAAMSGHFYLTGRPGSRGRESREKAERESEGRERRGVEKGRAEGEQRKKSKKRKREEKYRER